jgi:hypothetical protein
MNQLRCLTNPSNESLEIAYLCLTEAEALVERADENCTASFDKNAYNTLSHLANRLGFCEVRTSLARINDTELRLGIGAERRRQLRTAFDADKVRLFRRLDADLFEWTNSGAITG